MEPQVTMELSVPQVNAILTALGEQPANKSMDVILEIRKQVEPQLAPPIPEDRTP
jgi:hypothetical protein